MITDTAFEFIDKIGDEKWERDEYRQELILVAEAICVITGLFAKICEYDMEQKVDAKEWLDKYSKKWLEKNKQSELAEIQKVFLYLENNLK